MEDSDDQTYECSSSMVQDGSKDEKKKKPEPLCGKCRNHGVLVRLRGHKQNCPNKDCFCENCILAHIRREVMSKQQQVLKQEKGGPSTTSPSEDTFKEHSISAMKLISDFSLGVNSLPFVYAVLKITDNVQDAIAKVTEAQREIEEEEAETLRNAPESVSLDVGSRLPEHLNVPQVSVRALPISPPQEVKQEPPLLRRPSEPILADLSSQRLPEHDLSISRLRPSTLSRVRPRSPLPNNSESSIIAHSSHLPILETLQRPLHHVPLDNYELREREAATLRRPPDLQSELLARRLSEQDVSISHLPPTLDRGLPRAPHSLNSEYAIPTLAHSSCLPVTEPPISPLTAGFRPWRPRYPGEEISQRVFPYSRLNSEGGNRLEELGAYIEDRPFRSFRRHSGELEPRLPYRQYFEETATRYSLPRYHPYFPHVYNPYPAAPLSLVVDSNRRLRLESNPSDDSRESFPRTSPPSPLSPP